MIIRRRLEALERRSSSSGGMTIYTILGGMPEPYLKTATAGLHKFQQETGEHPDVFQKRVIELANVGGERLVMIGGLPDDD